MNGKLIVIEATDGCGKATQTNELYKKLNRKGYKVKKIEFPDYKSDSSALIKMYLNGDFGNKPEDVNAYVSSTFYAVDRFASYKRYWKSFLADGGIVLCDRYTTSNMIHQGVKIKDQDKKDSYLNWLWDFEFNIFNLPVPDCVIFLDIPFEKSLELIKNRNKEKDNNSNDIHEKDINYLKDSYYNALYIAEKYSWHKINCIKDNKLRTIEDIHTEIYEFLKNHIIGGNN